MVSLGLKYELSVGYIRVVYTLEMVQLFSGQRKCWKQLKTNINENMVLTTYSKKEKVCVFTNERHCPVQKFKLNLFILLCLI